MRRRSADANFHALTADALHLILVYENAARTKYSHTPFRGEAGRVKGRDPPHEEMGGKGKGGRAAPACMRGKNGSWRPAAATMSPEMILP